MATLTVTDLVPAGTALTFATPAAGGDEFANPADGSTILLVANDSTNVRTVTITPAVTTLAVPGAGTVTIPTLAMTIGAVSTKSMGPVPSIYNNTNNRVAVTYSSTTNLTVLPIRVPKI